MEWIKNLKVGDMVIVYNRYWTKICPVEKITPTGRINAGGTTFNPNGTERGGDPWCSSYLREATPEAVQEIRENETVQKAFREMKSATKLSYNQAIEILKILDPPEE